MSVWSRIALAAVGAVMVLGAGASAQAKDVLGAACTRPAADRCAGEVCATSGALAHPGTATDPATGRKFFLDYPCDLKPGDKVVFLDMSHYTMVKNTTFNGVQLPSIATFEPTTGELKVVRRFGYEDYKSRLS